MNALFFLTIAVFLLVMFIGNERLTKRMARGRGRGRDGQGSDGRL